MPAASAGSNDPGRSAGTFKPAALPVADLADPENFPDGVPAFDRSNLALQVDEELASHEVGICLSSIKSRITLLQKPVPARKRPRFLFFIMPNVSSKK